MKKKKDAKSGHYKEWPVTVDFDKRTREEKEERGGVAAVVEAVGEKKRNIFSS